jgi:hypothetical protein
MALRGQQTPALLENRELPPELRVVWNAYQDLTHDGYVLFSEYERWCRRYGVVDPVQFDYIWDVLNEALSRYTTWKRKRDKSSQNNSRKTTGT